MTFEGTDKKSTAFDSTRCIATSFQHAQSFRKGEAILNFDILARPQQS
jgi:hypothetical protein